MLGGFGASGEADGNGSVDEEANEEGPASSESISVNHAFVLHHRSNARRSSLVTSVFFFFCFGSSDISEVG
tara:strand:+ start:718 stop:930 length:213 start_codon:yes stop_codon:yes gene_type:complete